MGEFMPNDINVLGEAAEDLAVSIAERHFLAVPEGVVHPWWSWDVIVVKIADQREVVVINGVTIEHLFVEFIRLSEVVYDLECAFIGFESGEVIAFRVNQLLAQSIGLVGIINLPNYMLCLC